MWDQQSITDLCDVTSCSGLGRQQSVIWFMNFKPSCLGSLDPPVVCQQQQPLPQRDIFIYFMFMFNACDLCSALLSRPWWKIPTALSSDLHPPLQQLSVSLITAFQSVLHKFILLSVSASPTTSARARIPPPPLAPPSPVLVSRSLSFGCCLTSRFTSASCQGLLSSFISLCGFFGLFLSDSLSDDTRKFMKRRKWKGITGNVWCLGYQHSFIQAEANVWILCTKHLSVFLIYNKCSCFISVINIK